MIDYTKRPARIDYTKRPARIDYVKRAPVAAEVDAHQEMLAGMARGRRAYALTVARQWQRAHGGHTTRA